MILTPDSINFQEFKTQSILEIKGRLLNVNLDGVLSSDTLGRLPDVDQQNGFIRVALAVLGYSRAKFLLDEAAESLTLESYVGLGSFCAYSAGRFEEQMRYLSLAVIDRPWLVREKVRCLIRLRRLDEALAILQRVLMANPAVYAEFAASMFWQLNEWQSLQKISSERDLKNVLPYIRYYEDHCRRDGDDSIRGTVRCIYNEMTLDQAEFWRMLSRKNNFQLELSRGLLLNRLPRAYLRQLGGPSFNLGIMGAAAAHLKALEEFLSSGEDFCVVVESDAYPTANWQLLEFIDRMRSNGVDFLLCSNRHAPLVVDQISSEILPYVFKGRASGFDGYFVSGRAAEMICEAIYTPPFVQHVDGKVIKELAGMDGVKLGVTSQALFAQSFFSTFSTRTAVEIDY